MLPAGDQQLAHEFVRKLVLAWNPDFTKAAPEEAAYMKIAEESECVRNDDIDLDKIER